MIQQMIEDKYGIQVDVRQKMVTLAVGTPAELVDRNPNRLGLFLANVATGSAMVGYGAGLVSNGFIYVGAAGGWFNWWWEEDMLWQCENFYGVLTAGAGSMLVREIIALRRI